MLLKAEEAGRGKVRAAGWAATTTPWCPTCARTRQTPHWRAPAWRRTPLSTMLTCSSTPPTWPARCAAVPPPNPLLVSFARQQQAAAWGSVVPQVLHLAFPAGRAAVMEHPDLTGRTSRPAAPECGCLRVTPVLTKRGLAAMRKCKRCQSQSLWCSKCAHRRGWRRSTRRGCHACRTTCPPPPTATPRASGRTSHCPRHAAPCLSTGCCY